MYTDTHSQLGMSLPGGYCEFQVTGMINGCFAGVGKFGKNFFVFFFGYSKQFEVCGSVLVGQPYSSPNKVLPKLFSGCVNI